MCIGRHKKNEFFEIVIEKSISVTDCCNMYMDSRSVCRFVIDTKLMYLELM